MSEYTGYHGNSLEFLKVNKISIGDSVKILGDITYSGIVMPRYEHSDDKHIVLKLKSGYNIGLEIKNIEKVEKKLKKQAEKEMVVMKGEIRRREQENEIQKIKYVSLIAEEFEEYMTH